MINFLENCNQNVKIITQQKWTGNIEVHKEPNIKKTMEKEGTKAYLYAQKGGINKEVAALIEYSIRLRNIFCFFYFLLDSHSSPKINSIKMIQRNVTFLKILCHLQATIFSPKLQTEHIYLWCVSIGQRKYLTSRDSSYTRLNLPVLNQNTLILRSGDVTTNWVPSLLTWERPAH